jgi:hypothetical protein
LDASYCCILYFSISQETNLISIWYECNADMLPQLLVMPMENRESVAEQKYYSLVKESLEEFKIVFEELVRSVL